MVPPPPTPRPCLPPSWEAASVGEGLKNWQGGGPSCLGQGTLGARGRQRTEAVASTHSEASHADKARSSRSANCR